MRSNLFRACQSMVFDVAVTAATSGGLLVMSARTSGWASVAAGLASLSSAAACAFFIIAHHKRLRQCETHMEFLARTVDIVYRSESAPVIWSDRRDH